jgi:hypothetical protein
MAERVTEYKKLLKRTKDKNYDVRELPGCFVVKGNSGSIVVYQNGDHKSSYTVCIGEKRDVCKLDTVDETIDRYVK